jgi:hypothetical protein
MKIRIAVFFALVIAALGFTLAPASAHTETITHSGTYFGDVVVEPDQVVNGTINVVNGDATIEGRVNGDVNDFGGTVTTEDGAVITGETHMFGNGMTSWLPWMPYERTVAHQNHRLMVRLAYSVIVLLAFLIFPLRVRTALDRIEHHPGLSAAVGVIAFIAVIPLAIILLITVVGIPLIPVEFIAIFAGILIGQAALGVLIGRRLYEMVRPHSTPSPLCALVCGLVVLSAAEIVPVIGGLVTALVLLVGLGAAILAFGRDTMFPIGPSSSGPSGSSGSSGGGSGFSPRPPIGGPPMRSA